MKISALYIHIPFCRKICPFCGFAVMRDRKPWHDEYLQLLQQEYSLLSKKLPLDFSAIESVYIGGGTPSSFSPVELKRLSAWIHTLLPAQKDVLWSMELNPEDVTAEYIDTLSQIGVQRVSLGIQSFQQKTLSALGRSHSANDAEAAVQCIKTSGIKDFNLDLMFGFPGQGIDDLKKDLKRFIALRPTHVSAYCLNIEKKTILARRDDWSAWQIENEDQIVAMYELIIDELEKSGLMQYEVSNFSRPGFRSLQNELNWAGKNYLGMGMGAHSLISPYRFGNVRRWVDYKKQLHAGQLPRDLDETLSEQNHRDERLMIQLRLTEGVHLAEFFKQHSISSNTEFDAKVNMLYANGLATQVDGRLKLTRQGLMLADEIAVSLAAAL